MYVSMDMDMRGGCIYLQPSEFITPYMRNDSFPVWGVFWYLKSGK